VEMQLAQLSPLTDQRFHGYKLAPANAGLTFLGSGSFGVVLDVIRVNDQKRCALKIVLCSDPDPAKQQAQVDERRAEKILTTIPPHENVIQLMEYFELPADDPSVSPGGALLRETRAYCVAQAKSGAPFPQLILAKASLGATYCVLAYELGGQRDLFDWMEQWKTDANARAPPDDRLRMVAQQVALALAHIHEHGIVHHDLKLENVTVMTGARETIKLIDFGLARRAEEGHPGFEGSLTCAAPEMHKPNDYVGAPADVWSFGVLLFTLGFVVPPFGSASTTGKNECSHGLYRKFLQTNGGSITRHYTYLMRSWPQLMDNRGADHESPSGFLVLIEACLQPSPAARPTMSQIAAHPMAAGDWHRPIASVPASPGGGGDTGVARRGIVRPREPSEPGTPEDEPEEGSSAYRSLSGAPSEAQLCYRNLGVGGDDDMDDADDSVSNAGEVPPSAEPCPLRLRRVGALGPAAWRQGC